MPSLDYNFLNKLQENYKLYTNFIETGTLMGDTIFEMEKFFCNLYTVEIKKEFYDKVKNKYFGDKINFYLGDSSIVLGKILPIIKGKSIIFLDGHWSGGNTGKGVKDCPLYEELKNIILHHKEEAIIIIDDVRLFGKGPIYANERCNWKNINIKNILQIVNSRKTKEYFIDSKLYKNDRFIIHVCNMIDLDHGF